MHFLIDTEWASIAGPCHLKPHYISEWRNVSAVYNNKENQEGELQFKLDSVPNKLDSVPNTVKEITEGGSQIQNAILKS